MTKALAAAFSGLPAAWAGAGLALLLLWALMTGGPLVATYFHTFWVCVAWIFALCLAKLMSVGALYRTALFGKDARKAGLGIGGLQIGAPELRLVVASLLAGVFFALIAGAIGIVFTVMLRMNEVDLYHGGAWTVAGAIVASAILLFVVLKFTLLHAANIAQSKLVVLNALGLSSGQVGKLFAGIVILVLPFALICAGLAHHFAPEIRLAHALPYPWMNQRMTLLLQGGLLFLNIGLLLPLLTGFFASAYRQIENIRAQ
ncbi:hypothetical protein ABAC402_04590 [Asticcacaulis sp. AC402]|nr:hypothetical protein ABAC402_04590 [Asticcacaulis sp. AC402]